MNYKHLTIEERIVLSHLKSSNYSICEIAGILRRSPSTISREFKRNSYKLGMNYSVVIYSVAKAQTIY